MALEANLGVSIPGAWYGTSKDQSVGASVAGSALVRLGWGWGVGLGAEWSRLPWTTRAGPSAHVSTWIAGLELRYTAGQFGRISPLAYLGLGWGGVSQSRRSSCAEVFGGPAGRAGIGVQARVGQRWRVGVSAGVVVQPPAIAGCAYDPASAVGDPGVPEAPGNVWSLRLSGGGDFL